MWRLLILFSVLPIAAALIARWWFGVRVLAQEGQQSCRSNPATWQSILSLENPPASEATAAQFGAQLRVRAIAEWLERDPKSAKSRENSRRFGMAVPPLSGVVALMAVIVAKIPPFGAIAILLVATALASAVGLLSLAPELRAIAHTARSVRQTRAFPRRDDEDAVVNSSIAHAWLSTLPPILSFLK